MLYGDNAKMMQPQAANQIYQVDAMSGAASAPMSESEFMLDRLRTVRGKLSEIYGMSKVAGEKIIGPSPDKIQSGEIGGKPSPIPQGFLHIASQLIGEIDATASEIAEQLARLHRSF